MLRDFGVKGVKVQEIVSLEDEMLALLQYVLRATGSMASYNKFVSFLTNSNQCTANRSMGSYSSFDGRKMTQINRSQAVQRAFGLRTRFASAFH